MLIPSRGAPSERSTWFKRDRLALYEIAFRSVGKTPKPKIEKEPEISCLRTLKDAINDGKLHSFGVAGKPNMTTRVHIEEFGIFAKESGNTNLQDFLRKWERGNGTR